MTWRPAARVFVMVAPWPSDPATSEAHVIRDEMSPSRKSIALPVKVTAPDVENPSAGATIVRVGGERLSVTATVALPVAPFESTTLAVRWWVPTLWRTTPVSEPPFPRAPSRSDDQLRLAVTLPSSL